MPRILLQIVKIVPFLFPCHPDYCLSLLACMGFARQQNLLTEAAIRTNCKSIVNCFNSKLQQHYIVSSLSNNSLFILNWHFKMSILLTLNGDMCTNTVKYPKISSCFCLREALKNETAMFGVFS